MKLILRADVENLGRLGDLVEVKAGYGRNYLVPQGLAMQATKANLKAFELERKKLQQKMDALRAGAQSVADKVNSLVVRLEVRVGEGDKMYGSVTATNIADAMLEQGVEIDRRKLVLEDPIRALGEYDVKVKLHQDVDSSVKVIVAKYGAGQDEDVDEAEEAVEAPAEPQETEEEIERSDD